MATVTRPRSCSPRQQVPTTPGLTSSSGTALAWRCPKTSCGQVNTTALAGPLLPKNRRLLSACAVVCAACGALVMAEVPR